MSKTVDEVKKTMRDNGLSLPEWAKTHGFPVRSVRAVLYGHNKGNYGMSHKIAVALGLKAAPK